MWSAKKDLESAYISLTKSLVTSHFGTTLIYNGPYSILVYTSDPDLLDGVKKSVESVGNEENSEAKEW